MVGMKALRINAARDHRQTFEPARGKLGHQGFGGDRRAVRQVMEGSEVAHDRLIEPPQPVVAAIRMKIRSKIRTNRQLQASRCLQGRPTQGPLGRNVHNVWTLQGPLPYQKTLGRQPHSQLAVTRDLDAMDEEFVNRQPAVWQPRRRGLVRLMGLLTNPLMTLTGPDQADLVLARLQTPNELGQCHRDTVDFGRVGFGDKSDPQRPLG